MTDSTFQSCSILLLAGGRGQRMGGQDKGLLEWRGRPLIAWLHDVARPLTDELLLSCNRNHARYAGYADLLVSDDEDGFLARSRGYAPGLPPRATAGCSCCHAIPLVDRPLLHSLYSAAISTPDQPVMLRCGEQWEPLFCVIPTSMRAEIDAFWRAGERSPQRILLKLGARELQVRKDDPRLANLNTPELLKASRSELGTSS